MRTTLGRPMANGVLSRSVPTKDKVNREIAQIMRQYKKDIGSQISDEDMEMYINMGERILQAIHQGKLRLLKDGTTDAGKGSAADGMDDDVKNVGLSVPDGTGGVCQVESNLETTRAISWYLQAKAVMDNASSERDPILLSRGSMVMKDPGGALFRFLCSGRQVSGRISSHFNELSTGARGNFSNTGAIGAVLNLIKPSKAQKGIEDFSGRMPSGKGTLLFGQLGEKSDVLKENETPLLFLKWETAGMPTVAGNVKHADDEEGARIAVLNHARALVRMVDHAINYYDKRVRNKQTDPEWGIRPRREDVNKEEAKPLFDDFVEIAKLVDKSWGEIKANEGRDYGLWRMKEILEEIKREHLADGQQKEPEEIEGLRERIQQLRKYIQELESDIEEFESKMGNNLGIARKGSEVHVSRDMSYLDGEPPATQNAPREVSVVEPGLDGIVPPL